MSAPIKISFKYTDIDIPFEAIEAAVVAFAVENNYKRFPKSYFEDSAMTVQTIWPPFTKVGNDKTDELGQIQLSWRSLDKILIDKYGSSLLKICIKKGFVNQNGIPLDSIHKESKERVRIAKPKDTQSTVLPRTIRVSTPKPAKSFGIAATEKAKTLEPIEVTVAPPAATKPPLVVAKAPRASIPEKQEPLPEPTDLSELSTLLDTFKEVNTRTASALLEKPKTKIGLRDVAFYDRQLRRRNVTNLPAFIGASRIPASVSALYELKEDIAARDSKKQAQAQTTPEPIDLTKVLEAIARIQREEGEDAPAAKKGERTVGRYSINYVLRQLEKYNVTNLPSFVSADNIPQNLSELRKLAWQQRTVLDKPFLAL